MQNRLLIEPSNHPNAFGKNNIMSDICYAANLIVDPVHALNETTTIRFDRSIVVPIKSIVILSLFL